MPPTANQRHLASVVFGRLRSRTLGRDIAPGHTAIDNEIRAVDKAALVASKEQDRLCLLDSLTKTTAREVDFTAVALGRIVAKPVLKERSAARVNT
jgi:hypothetical protein